MIAAVAGLARLLMIDPRSQRAIDETLLDCTKELDGASTLTARTVCHFHSVAAIARAVLSSLPREVSRGRIGSVLGRFAVFSFVPSVVWLLATASFARHPADPLPLSLLEAARMNAWWFAMIVAFVLPFAWFLAAMWRQGEGASRIGLAVTAFVVSIVFTGWLGPLTARQSHDVIWDRQGLVWRMQGLTVEAPTRWSGIPTLLEFVRTADLRDVLFIRAYTVAVPALSAALVLLATVLPARYRWRWAVVVLMALVAQRVVPELLRTPGPLRLDTYFLDLLVFSYVVAIGVVVTAAFVLLRREAVAPSPEP